MNDVVAVRPKNVCKRGLVVLFGRLDEGIRRLLCGCEAPALLDRGLCCRRRCCKHAKQSCSKETRRNSNLRFQEFVPFHITYLLPPPPPRPPPPPPRLPPPPPPKPPPPRLLPPPPKPPPPRLPPP